MKKNQQFKPMLLPNEKIDINTIKEQVIASVKLDGIRCLFIKGKMLSRSLKPIQNIQLQKRYEPLKKYSKDHNIIIDGELYSTTLTFQEITSVVMTEDKSIPENFGYYVFDAIKDEKYDEPYIKRLTLLEDEEFTQFKHVTTVPIRICKGALEIAKYFDECVKNGFEGLILRMPNSKYKLGRWTLKEAQAFKLKPFVTLDGVIKDVIQSTEAREGSEKKIDELGHSKTSQKKDDRVLIEKASAFVVDYKGMDLKVTIAETDEKKKEIWQNKKDYIGKTLEYKCMEIGQKLLPRHPISLRIIDSNTK